MAKLYNLARVTTETTGSGPITLGSAVSGYLSFENAGAQSGDVVTYGIRDSSNSEVGRGTYTSGSDGDFLSRDTVTKSTNSNNKISLSGSAEVYITVLAEDIWLVSYKDSLSSLGLDQNRNTAGTYTYAAQNIRVVRPILLDAVLWDIRIAGNYTLTIRDAEDNILYTILVEGIGNGSEDVVFALSPNVVIPPGGYILRLTVSGAAVLWSDRNSNTDYFFSPFDILGQINYGGTPSNYRAPLRLRYYDSEMNI